MHGFARPERTRYLQNTHTDGYASVPVRRYELTRLRETFIIEPPDILLSFRQKVTPDSWNTTELLKYVLGDSVVYFVVLNNVE